MTTLYDVPAATFIQNLAGFLKKQEVVKPPDWGPFVKTGGNREKRPDNSDWWYIRGASIMRKIYLQGPIGVHNLQKIYGGKKNQGYKPEKKSRGSGAIIRTLLQQLEKAGLVKKTGSGRITTSKGVSLLDKISQPNKKA